MCLLASKESLLCREYYFLTPENKSVVPVSSLRSKRFNAVSEQRTRNESQRPRKKCGVTPPPYRPGLARITDCSRARQFSLAPRNSTRNSTTRILHTPFDKYRKIPKISPGAHIFQRPFLRGLFLACSGKEIYHFGFVFLCIRGQIPSTSTPGGFHSKGRLNGGVFALRF